MSLKFLMSIRTKSKFSLPSRDQSKLLTLIYHRTGLASRILEEKEKARSKLAAETEDVMEKTKKRKKEQKERSGSSKKQRYVHIMIFHCF